MTALRLLGALLLTAAGGLLGARCLAAGKRKIALLRELDAALALLAEELTALRAPLPEILERVRDRPFFALLHAGFGAEPTEKLWRRAAEAMDLDPPDREALAALSAVIGRYDAQRQAAEIERTRRRLRESAAALEAELRLRIKSYPGVGAAAGALLAILLL